ncbi:MAG: hypothetical protein IJF61_00170 [Clostridia bacterium]|nr:hypothetical protein [Clostridia bacterium]
MADHMYKPSEVPKGQRWRYFLDYYKYPTIFGVILLIALIYFLKSVVFAPKNDIVILAATRGYVSNEVWKQAEEKLKEMPLDINGDKKVLVDINDIFLDEVLETGDPEAFMLEETRLTSALMTAESALQIVDERMFAYLQNEDLLATYSELPDAKGNNPDELIKIPLETLEPFKSIENLPTDLYMTLRPKDAMQLGDSKKKIEAYEKQVEALVSMMQ